MYRSMTSKRFGVFKNESTSVNRIEVGLSKYLRVYEALGWEKPTEVPRSKKCKI